MNGQIKQRERYRLVDWLISWEVDWFEENKTAISRQSYGNGVSFVMNDTAFIVTWLNPAYVSLV